MGDAFERLGRYRIDGFLAEGGMGRVYVAFDTVLHRRVALKLVDGDAAVGRLLRGARAAATLSHPHVCRVFDAGELDDRPFIAMELIEGLPLRAVIGDGAASLAQRLRWMVDLADALAATHRAGVVHRDIKPDNVMIDAADQVKLLDFGIATWEDGAPTIEDEPTAEDAPMRGEFQTQAGRVVGTRGYMAPEQLAGEPADARTDQFAWAVLAYETIGGRHPAADEAPLLSALVPELPFGVAAVIAKAMALDPADRFADMAALVAQLASRIAPAEPPRRRWRGFALVGATAVAATLLLFTQRATPRAAQITRAPQAAPWLAISAPRRLTFGDRCEEFPSFLPDGRGLVYSATDGDGNHRLYTSALDAAGQLGAPRPILAATGDGWDMAAAVSPDGERVAYLHLDEHGGAAMVAPLDGSAPPRAIGDPSLYPRWTDRDLWIAQRGIAGRMDGATSALLPLALPAGLRASWVATSPDGRIVAHVNRGDPDAPLGLAVFAPGGQLARQIDVALEPAMAIAPDGAHLLASRKIFGGNAELVAIPLDGEPIRSLAETGITARDGLAISRDADRLAWSTCHAVARISAVTPDGTITPVLDDEQADAIAFAAVPGSSKLAVVSNRTGELGLWLVDRADPRRSPQRVATGDHPVRDVALSPDGTRFAVVIEAGGIGVGQLADAGATFQRRTDNANDTAPSFSHDGRTVVFTRWLASGKLQMYAVDVDPGEPVAPTPIAIQAPGSHHGVVAPGGDRLAFFAGAPTETPMIAERRDALAHPLSAALPRGRYRLLRFSPDGRRLALVRGDRELVEVDSASGAVLRTTMLPPADALYSLAYAGDALIALHVRWQGNLWLADARFAATAPPPPR